ncbi:MFS transporter [Candidatus Bathyarchaeota archaeon]|nr:MFS transporter [Candidatus Bathyarchaeota archaeon]
MKYGLLNSKNAYVAILLLGITSLMGDLVYEGSRGIVTPYLEFLGASTFAIVFFGRFGEFLGYALRFVSGRLADTTRAYWLFIFLGYGLIASIPLLGITRVWEIAIILVLLERIGKAIRSPARDAVLSILSRGVGAGKAFGIHELLDQIGAILGPLIVVGLMLYTNNNYNLTFSLLALPFLMLVAFLAYTFRKVGWRKAAEPAEAKLEKGEEKLGKAFYVYTLAVLLNTVGLIPFELISFKATKILKPTNQLWIVPLIYTLIQGMDAPTALFAGFAYDRFKIRVLVLPFILSVIPTFFAMANADLTMLIVAAAFFGLVLGMQESIYRAAVSGFAPISLRGTAYGIFNTVYGVGMLAGGAVYGLIAQLNIPYLVVVVYVFITQAAAVILLFKAHSKTQHEERKGF